MIPLADILSTASRSPVVRKVAVGVVVVAVALFGVRLVFGSDVRVVTTSEADGAVKLADCAARLELTDRAMTSCSVALSLCSGVAP